jgi:hypothetical protein
MKQTHETATIELAGMDELDELDDIQRRLQFSHLRATRELLVMERASLLREITSPLTSQDRREEAVMRRMDLFQQYDEITYQLKTINWRS